jgi:hypothetical protein
MTSSRTSAAETPIGRWGWLFAAGLCCGGLLLLQSSPRAQPPDCAQDRAQASARLAALEHRKDTLQAAFAAESARARLIEQRAERHAPGEATAVGDRLRPAIEGAGAALLAVECDRQPCVAAIAFPPGAEGARTPTLKRLRAALQVDDRHDQVVAVDGLVVVVSPVGPAASPGADSARLARLLADVMEGVR